MPTKVLTANNAMGASGPAHAPGFVPDPGATAGTDRFLREDATFAQLTASQVQNAADVTAANTFTQLNTFTNGIKVGASADFGQILIAAGTLTIEASLGTLPILLGLQPASLTAAACVLESTVAEVVFALETVISSTTYVGATQLETNPTNFLSNANTVEYQAGAQKSPTGTIPPIGFAVGDVDITAKLPVVFLSTATLNADPTTNLEAATKQYVDSKFSSGFTGTVPLAKLTTGGTSGSLTIVNGLITVAVNPT